MGRPIRKMIMRSPFLFLRKKSSWNLKPSKNTTLESFIDLVTNDVQTAVSTNIPTYNNLTPAEKGAIQDLKEKDDIVIKPADKCRAVVVMDKVDYLEEANRQLTDERFYKTLDTDPTEEFSTKITQDLKIMKENSHIDKNTFHFWSQTNPKPDASIYYLKFIKSTSPSDPLFQQMGTPQKKSQIRRFPPSTSCRCGTLIFEKHYWLSSKLPSTILVPMDVTSLYTSIPHNDGIEACREAWDQKAVKEPPTECIVQLLTLVLKHNNFIFNGEHFLQINGTVMGTKMAPSYSNIFMGKRISYSQALRIKRICSNEQTTKTRLGELTYHLKKRGYNNASINHCFNTASGIDRKDLIQYKEKKTNNRVPFVITYHHVLSNLSNIARKHWTTIQKHP